MAVPIPICIFGDAGQRSWTEKCAFESISRFRGDGLTVVSSEIESVASSHFYSELLNTWIRLNNRFVRSSWPGAIRPLFGYFVYMFLYFCVFLEAGHEFLDTRSLHLSDGLWTNVIYTIAWWQRAAHEDKKRRSIRAEWNLLWNWRVETITTGGLIKRISVTRLVINPHKYPRLVSRNIFPASSNKFYHVARDKRNRTLNRVDGIGKPFTRTIDDVSFSPRSIPPL